MSVTDTNRANLAALIEGISSGRLMEVFDTYYSDDIVMSENGAAEPSRVGKAANRAYEQYFVDNAEWHGLKLGAVVADGDNTGYRMWMDLSFQGNRMQRDQWAHQEWKDGKIVKETFFYKG